MKTASIMMAGAVIGNLVIVPAIAMFGDAVPGLISPGTERDCATWISTPFNPATCSTSAPAA